ncbi:putative methyltransferase [Clostridium acetireducens DSM 10703]|uniref:Putative methyltransferase n=1 Tax=Clostridium acetireducens DSM 10703 TaxID=1121290 RepID=A0A1E8F0X7_9CLOT|nr:site-specific DNA-methyltransferase [Clostridium acetireducens]OFI07088.1 putative methyltransferase [Clostridium acetireducens DSM 10703]
MDKFKKIPIGIFNKIEHNKQEFINKFINDLENLFPETIKDGIVDFQALLDRFGEYEDSNKIEKYNMTWVGKKQAIKEADEDILGRTLKYVEEDSKKPESTENIYIEGDNLEVLKLLRQSYYGKIKMIYIDPPYNTGNDFVYKDDFAMTEEEYAELSGEVDEYGERLVKNSKDSGRYHSNWLNMMYPRLKVARDLLTDDGVIFISIDDNEVHNMKKICDEIFGEKNFIGQVSRITKKTSDSGQFFAPSIDYILVYSKDIFKLSNFKIPLSEKQKSDYNKDDEKGKYKIVGFYQASLTLERSRNARYYIKCPDGTLCIPPEGKRWRCIKETFDEMLKNNEIEFIKTKTSPLLNKKGEQSEWNIYTKQYLKGRMKEGRVPRNYIDNIHNVLGTRKLKHLSIPFNFPKPSNLIEYIISMVDYQDEIKDYIILDFFAGSSTTAHAVMDLNAEDGGNRKYIMVQLPEPTDEKSEAYKVGYKNIAEIGKERIRRAGEDIKKKLEEKYNSASEEERKSMKNPEDLDIGFKAFRVEDTNLKRAKDTTVGMDLAELKALSIKDAEDFNPHFTDIDVVYEMILKRQDIDLTERITLLEDIGQRTYLVGCTMLICLEEEITKDMVEKIGSLNVDLSWIIMRDSAFGNNINLKLNTVKRLRAIVKENHKKEQKIYWI